MKKFPELEQFDSVQSAGGSSLPSASLPLQPSTAASPFGGSLLPNVPHAGSLTGTSAVSTLGGGVYEAPVAYPGPSGSPPPILSPTSRYLGAVIGPVGSPSVSPPVHAVDLGLNALNDSLASLHLISSQGSSSSGSNGIGGAGGGGGSAAVGSAFYSAFPSEPNRAVSVGAAQSSLFPP